MYCPKCGNNSEPGQRYCRNCGQDLQGVSEALYEDEQPRSRANPIQWIRGNCQRCKLFRIGFLLAWMGLLATIGLGVGGDMLAEVWKVGGRLMNNLCGFAVVVMLGGAGLMGYAWMFLSPKDSDSGKLPGAQYTKSIGEGPQSIQRPDSITERTTYRLEVNQPEARTTQPQ